MLDLRKLDLNLLVVLDVLLDEKNVSGGARRLGLSQPATSAALGRIRMHLDDPILIRGKGEMFLSPRALLLRDPLKEVLHAIRGIVSERERSAIAEIDARFRIVMSDHMGFVLAPLISKIARKEAPSATVEILPLERPRVFESLNAGTADLAVVLVGGKPRGLHSAPLLEDDFVFVCRPNHPLCRKRVPTWKRLTGFPVVDFTLGQDLLAPVFRHFTRIDPDWRPSMTVPHFLMMLPILQSDDFVAVMGRSAARFFERNGLAASFEMPDRLPPSRFELAWHPRMIAPPEQVWLRSVLLRAADELRHAAA